MFRLRHPLKIIIYFIKTISGWNLPKQFLGIVEYMCPNLPINLEAKITSDATINYHVVGGKLIYWEERSLSHSFPRKYFPLK